MPRPYRTTVTGTTTPAVSTPWMPSMTAPFEIGISADFGSTGSSGVISVQYTFDPIFDDYFGSSISVVLASLATWHTMSGFSSVAVDTVGVFTTPCVGIRAVHTSTAAASVATITILQSGA